MPDQQSVKFSINVNTLITVLCSTLLALLVWANKQQNEYMFLKMQQDASNTYVTKTDYRQEMDSVRQWNMKMSGSLTDLKTLVEQNHYDTMVSINGLKK